MGGYDDTLRKWLGNDGEEYTEYRRPHQKIGSGDVKVEKTKTEKKYASPRLNIGDMV